MAARDVTEARLLLFDEEEDPEGDEEHEEAPLGDGEEEEDDDGPDEVFVSRSRLSTFLTVSVAPAPSCEFVPAPPTATKPPLDRLRE